MPTRKQSLRQSLVGAGLLPGEAATLSSGYTARDFRTLPYLRKIVQTRRLYVANLKSRGYSDALIKQYIKDLYLNKNWLKDNKADPWQMIRDARQRDIDRGEYIPPKRKGSHHGQGVSKGDVKGQKSRTRRTSPQQKIENLNAQIRNTSDPGTKEWLIGLRNKLQGKK